MYIAHSQYIMYTNSFQQTTSADNTALHPVILDEILQDYKESVRRMLRIEAKGPESHTREYDKYQFLVSRQVSVYGYR